MVIFPFISSYLIINFVFHFMNQELKNVFIIIDTMIGTIHFVVIGYEVVNHCLPLSGIVICASVGLRLMFGWRFDIPPIITVKYSVFSGVMSSTIEMLIQHLIAHRSNIRTVDTPM